MSSYLYTSSDYWSLISHSQKACLDKESQMLEQVQEDQEAASAFPVGDIADPANKKKICYLLKDTYGP